MHCRDLMLPVVLSCHAEDSVEECVSAAERNDALFFPVLSAYGLPIGYVTRSMLVDSQAKGLHTLAVKRVMTAKFATCSIEDSPAVAAQMLVARSCSTLLVLNEGGEVAGFLGAEQLGERLDAALSGDKFRELFGARRLPREAPLVAVSAAVPAELAEAAV